MALLRRFTRVSGELLWVRSTPLNSALDVGQIAGKRRNISEAEMLIAAEESEQNSIHLKSWFFTSAIYLLLI